MCRAAEAERPEVPVSLLLINQTAETVVGVVGAEVRVWDMHTSVQVFTITLHGVTSAEITALAFDRPLERKLYIGTHAGELIQINYVTGELMGEVPGSVRFGLRFGLVRLAVWFGSVCGLGRFAVRFGYLRTIHSKESPAPTPRLRATHPLTAPPFLPSFRADRRAPRRAGDPHLGRGLRADRPG